MTWGSCQTSIYKRFQLLNSMPKSVITQISKHMCSFCAILNLDPVAKDFLTTWHLYWVTFPYFGPFLFAFIWPWFQFIELFSIHGAIISYDNLSDVDEQGLLLKPKRFNTDITITIQETTKSLFFINIIPSFIVINL